jgi:hypothetical protein
MNASKIYQFERIVHRIIENKERKPPAPKVERDKERELQEKAQELLLQIKKKISNDEQFRGEEEDQEALGRKIVKKSNKIKLENMRRKREE